MTDKELDELEARLRKHAVVVAQANPTIRVVSDVLEWQAADAISTLRAREKELEGALRGMLRHSCVADAAPEDKDGEDHMAESRALAALKGKEPQ